MEEEKLEQAALMHFKDVMERKAKTNLETANMTSFKEGARWAMKQIEDIVQMHFDKSLQNFSDSRAEEGEESTSTCYWDGYSDCAKCIMREI